MATPWDGRPLGPVAISVENRETVDGRCRARIGGRTSFRNGIGQELLGRLESGRSHRVSVWARLDGVVNGGDLGAMLADWGSCS